MAQSELIEKINGISTGGAIMLSLMLAGLYYLGAYDDGSKIEKAMVKIQSEIKTESAKKEKTASILQEADSVRAEVATLSERFQAASAKLPSELKSQQLVDLIRTLVQNSGCRIVNIRSQDVEKKALYDEYPILIEIRGTYSNLLVFMFYVATVERITNIKEFVITNVDQATPGGIVKLAGSVVSYKFRPPEVSEMPAKKVDKKRKGSGA